MVLVRKKIMVDMNYIWDVLLLLMTEYFIEGEMISNMCVLGLKLRELCRPLDILQDSSIWLELRCDMILRSWLEVEQSWIGNGWCWSAMVSDV